MSTPDPAFTADAGLDQALALLRRRDHPVFELPEDLPELGVGEVRTLALLAAPVLGRAADLGAPTALAHMDPPTPWITWAMALWNASLNQNLLHESVSPFATEAEARVLRWLCPFFGMQGGHGCAGSTLANLAALWAARDAAGVRRVVASRAAHLSIEKACRLLQLEWVPVDVDADGRLDRRRLPSLEAAALVLTAGTTATGAIDPLDLAGAAPWTHVDAAWAGPLRLSPTHAGRLAGLEAADSVALSAHKWLFQPKESALVLFRDVERAHAAIDMASGYLARPNVGVQGSRGAAAIPLLATLLAWGREGLVQRLDRLMAVAETLADTVAASSTLELWGQPQSGVTVFRPRRGSPAALLQALPPGTFSTCVLAGEPWLRAVAANPSVDIERLCAEVLEAADRLR